MCGGEGAIGPATQERDESEATVRPVWPDGEGLVPEAAERRGRRSVPREARRLGRAARASHGEVAVRGPMWPESDAEAGERRRGLSGARAQESGPAGECAGPRGEPRVGTGRAEVRVPGVIASVDRLGREWMWRGVAAELSPRAAGRSARRAETGRGGRPRPAGASAHAGGAPGDDGGDLRRAWRGPVGRRPGARVGVVGEAEFEQSREQLREMRLELAR